MSDKPQPNITVVYQYPQAKDEGFPAWVWVVSIFLAFFLVGAMLCNGLAYLFS
jgi:hypothetical protein